MKTPNVFPVLKSQRLVMNRLEETDIPLIVKYVGNKKIADNTLHIPHPYTEDDAKNWLEFVNSGFENGTQYSFAIRVKPDTSLVGAMGLKVNSEMQLAEIGYWIAEEFWNRGYASEALELILEFGFFQLKLNKIFATHLVDNPASGKVMIKNSMIKEGELKEHTKKNGVFKDLIQYRLTQTEFLNLKNMNF